MRRHLSNTDFISTPYHYVQKKYQYDLREMTLLFFLFSSSPILFEVLIREHIQL